MWRSSARFAWEPDQAEVHTARRYYWWLLERDFFGTPIGLRRSSP